jgi:phosphoglucosamine mutase
MTSKYFGTDGIRGVANASITPEIAMKVAQATGIIFRRGDYRHRAVIGKDTRLSGYMIENALVSGFTSVGIDVLLLGPLPTPAVAMLTHSMRADVGVTISASHNPYEDNGIKLFGPDGYKLSDELEAKIEVLMDHPSQLKLSKPAELGRAMRVEGDRARYINFAKRTLSQAIFHLMAYASSPIAPMARPTKSRPRPCGNWAPSRAYRHRTGWSQY